MTLVCGGMAAPPTITMLEELWGPEEAPVLIHGLDFDAVQGSGMVTFELKGGEEAGKKVVESVQLILLAVSLGGVESLIQHPATMTHGPLPREKRIAGGITDGLVRLSVGIEAAKDLIADLDRALAEVP